MAAASTLGKTYFLTYEYLSKCGLQTLGECEWSTVQPQTPMNGTENPLNGAVQPQAPGIAVVILLMTHLAALLNTIIIK